MSAKEENAAALQAVLENMGLAGKVDEIQHKKTLVNSIIPEVLGGLAGALLGGVCSFGLVSLLGLNGVSAAGIASGLSTAGRVLAAVLGGLVSQEVAGIFAVCLPAIALAAAGAGLAAGWKNRKKMQQLTDLFEKAVAQEETTIQTLKNERDSSRRYIEHLQAEAAKAAVQEIQGTTQTAVETSADSAAFKLQL